MSALIKLTAFAVVLALSSSSIVRSPATSGDTFELLILHNNDMHARFEQTSQLSGTCTTEDREAGKCYGGFPRVAYVVKEARRKAATGEGPPVLYLNAGDTYTGTAWFTIYKWRVAAEFINALQPDAVSLGNHEFDNGVNGLTPFIENINTPVLAANLILTNTPELAKETNLKKSTVINVAGHKVGIVGYLTPDTKILAVKNDVEYIDEIVALKDEVSNLKSQGCKIIIALGHSGFSKDLEIGEQVDGIDLVIGGHSNTFLWNGTSPDSEEIQGPYPTYVEQASGKLVPVVQAYAYTKYLGKLHLVFDSNGNLISADGNPILLNNSIPQDHDMLQIVENYRVKVNNATQARMGTSLVPLDGLNCQRMECNLGNLIADAMIYTYAISYSGKYWTDAPIAIIQGGGIRASIAHTTKPAVITRGDLLTVLPFKGSISKVTMNGSILLEMIEHSVSRYNLLDYPGEYLQYSGIKVVYDLKLPSKSRVVEAKVRCGACDIPQYSLIENDKTYSVLMPTFVADGGDGYSMLVGLPRDTYPYDELFCLKTYLQRYSDVMPEVEGRSILLNLKAITSLSVALSPSYSTLLLLVSFAIFK